MVVDFRTEWTEKVFPMVPAGQVNDAIQVASRIPSARMGSIEVRPIMEFDQ